MAQEEKSVKSRPAEPPPMLTWITLCAYLAVALVAFVGSWKFHWPVVNLAVSFTLAALLGSAPAIVQLIMYKRHREEFKHFFGEKCLDEGFTLVSAERTVDDEDLDRLYAKGAPTEWRDPKEEGEGCR